MRIFILKLWGTYMIDHIPVCSDDSVSAWNRLYSWRIECAVKAGRRFYRALRRVIGNQHEQPDSWMTFLCGYCRPGSQAIKATVMTNNEFRDAIFQDMFFNSIFQCGENLWTCFPVADEETAFALHNTTIL